MIIDNQGIGKLRFFQDLYAEAKSKQDKLIEGLTKWYDQYRGDPRIDGSEVDAKVVRNITYELIESEVTGYIPSCKATPKMQSVENERNAKRIEKLIANKVNELPFETMNDIDERLCYIYGGSIWLVEWDESENVTHNTIGDVKVSVLSPKRFVGQPNIFNVQDMEYCFVTFDTTIEDIVRKYNVEEYVAEDVGKEEGDDEKTATLYICYYRDESGKICEYVWSGDTQLLDVDDFYARKRKFCKKCGKKEGLCECEKPSFKYVNEEYEELDQEILIDGGARTIPLYSPVVKDGSTVTKTVYKEDIGADGMPIIDIGADGTPRARMRSYEIPQFAKTRLPFYKPNMLPIVIRKNTSQEDSVLGQSDCEYIRPQQQAINKIESRIVDKLLKAGVVPIVPDGYTGVITDGIFDRAVKMKKDEINQFGRIDLQVDISRDIAEAERLYDHAKRILGISDSFQGQYDSSAQSGVAKQMQINQASGRLDSKRRMKNAAYADVYRIIFQLYLAYADEPRPVTYRDANGKLQNEEFNRYAYLKQDEAGEWYYDDGFIFAADAAVDLEQNREMLWEHNRLNFQQGAYGNPADLRTLLIFWQNMEEAHYPWAHGNVERIQQMIDAQDRQYEQQIAALTNELGNRQGYEEYLKQMIGGNENVR